MPKAKSRKNTVGDVIPLPSKQTGTPDVSGISPQGSKLEKEISKVNDRLELVVYVLLLGFITVVVSVGALVFDAYKFHTESYQEFKQTLSEQQKYNKDYKNLENSVNELTKQVGEINLILKNK